MEKRSRARGARPIAKAVRERLSYANVMATVAVFIALGGSAWALTANSVGTKQLKNNAVKTKKIANNAVTAPKLGCRGNSAQDKMVRVGSVCIDKYEASIWTKRIGGQRITGTIPCDADGQDCKGKIFARSVKGVPPRADVTWFQAQQALANSGKRLPTNAEWQQAVAGTPDGALCRVSGGSAQNTGSAAGCVSDWGANDMVGNLLEWVADWAPRAACNGSWGDLSDDFQGVCGAATFGAPGALLRGGSFNNVTGAGPFAVFGSSEPSGSSVAVGFRGAR
jgi:hypothetical protein